MTKLRKLMMLLGIVLVSSLSLASCGDDKEFPEGKLGAIMINVATPTATGVTVYWTICPTPNVDGYLIEIYQGTPDALGSLVTSYTETNNKGYRHTFENCLTPATTYTLKATGIPSANSGFTSADSGYFQFTTRSN